MESASAAAPPLSVPDMLPLRAASFSIRAPVTVDRDSPGSSPRDGLSSDEYIGSIDGSVSGDDGTGNVFESAFENDPDEKTVQETHFLQVRISKPFIVDPGEGAAKEENDRHMYGFSGRNQNEAFARASFANESLRIRVRKQEESTDGEWSDDSSETGEKLVEKEDPPSLNGSNHRPLARLAADGDSLENDQTFPEAGRVSSSGEFRAPIARISCDIDGDSHGSEVFEEEEEEEEEGVSSPLGIPSDVIMERLDSAPKVGTLESDSSEPEPNGLEGMKLDIENSHVSSVSSVAEKIMEHNSDATEEHQVPESDTEYVDLDKHAESIHLPSDSAVEVGFLYEECEKLLTAEEEPGLRGVDDQFVTCCTEEEDRLSEVTESNALCPVFEEIGGSMSIHQAEDFSPEDHFNNPSCMILATRMIAEAMNPRMLVQPSITGSCSDSRDEEEERLDKLHKICDLLNIVDHSPKDYMASEVLNWLKIAESRSLFKAANFSADNTAFIEPEAHGKHGMKISLSILVIGKTGVGKSATINSVFGENKSGVDAFKPTTKEVLEVTGMIGGVKLSMFDTPGLRTSRTDQHLNRMYLSWISKVISKSKPDVVLYVDRLDMPMNYNDDMILMKSITTHLGPEIWKKSVVVLTHASSESPHGANEFPLSDEEFVSQRSQILQRLISAASAGLDVWNSPPSAVPVCLVENHSSKVEGSAEKVPHWRSELLDFCYITKTLSKVHSLVGTENGSKSPSFFPPALPKNVLSEPSQDLKFTGSLSGSYQGEDVQYNDVYELKQFQEPVKLEVGRASYNDINLIVCSKSEYRLSVGKMPVINISTDLNEEKPSRLFSLKIRHLDQLQLAALVVVSIAKFRLSKFLSQTKND